MALTKAHNRMIKGSEVNALDFMSDAQKEDVLSLTGSLDVTAALQAAINATQTAKGTLVFAAGAYRVSDTLNVTEPINMIGNRAQIWQETANKDLFYMNGGGTSAGFIRNTFVMKDFILGTADGTGAAIHNHLFHMASYEDISVPYCGYGFRLQGTILSRFTNCRVSGTLPASPGFFIPAPAHRNTRGFYMQDNQSGVTMGHNANTLTQCYVQSSSYASYTIDGGNNCLMINCDSEYPSGTGAQHIIATNTINTHLISGDYEGNPCEIIFDNCTAPYVEGIFNNFRLRFKAGTKNGRISGGVIKTIILDSGSYNTYIDQVTLYTGASGISDNATYTYVGVVYNMQNGSYLAGGFGRRDFTPLLSIGGTTSGHTITGANGVLINRGFGTWELYIRMTYNAFTGSGNVGIDCSAALGATISSSTARIGRFDVVGLRADVGTGYSHVYGTMDAADGILDLKKRSNTKAAGDTSLDSADMYNGFGGAFTIHGFNTNNVTGSY